MPRIKKDLLKILNAALANKLNKIKIKWNKNKCMTTVICAKGYPNKYLTDKNINLNKIKISKKMFIFHGGTKIKDNSLVSNGGRVLSVAVMGNSFLLIRNKISKLIKKINWKHGFFRKDIGWRVIKSK